MLSQTVCFSVLYFKFNKASVTRAQMDLDFYVGEVVISVMSLAMGGCM